MTAGTKGISPALLLLSQQSRTAVRYKRQQQDASPACLITAKLKEAVLPLSPKP